MNTNVMKSEERNGTSKWSLYASFIGAYTFNGEVRISVEKRDLHG